MKFVKENRQNTAKDYAGPKSYQDYCEQLEDLHISPRKHNEILKALMRI